MRIHVELYGALKAYAPGNDTSFVLTLKPDATLGDVFKLLSIQKDSHVSLINGRRVTKENRLEEGDTLVLFPPICGG